jgi:hypothetical protein
MREKKMQRQQRCETGGDRTRSQLLAAFGKLCALEKKEQGRAFLNCHSDEHYVPSLLALAGQDNATDCSGSTTLAEWMVSKYGDAYPRYFLSQEISGDFLEHLRCALFTIP